MEMKGLWRIMEIPLCYSSRPQRTCRPVCLPFIYCGLHAQDCYHVKSGCIVHYVAKKALLLGSQMNAHSSEKM